MSAWPSNNLVHAALAMYDASMLTSPDGKRVQVTIEAIASLLRNPPPMLQPERRKEIADGA